MKYILTETKLYLPKLSLKNEWISEYKNRDIAHFKSPRLRKYKLTEKVHLEVVAYNNPIFYSLWFSYNNSRAPLIFTYTQKIRMATRNIVSCNNLKDLYREGYKGQHILEKKLT